MTVRYLRLADVCEINPRLPRTHGLVDDDEVSFVPMAAVDEVSGAIKSAEVRRYAEVKKGYTSFADGDVLFAKITPCMENGKAALVGDLVGGRGFGSTEFHVLRAGDQVMPEWLRYFVRREAFRHEAKRNFTGTAGQQRVPASFLQNALIPVPSRGEQQRIVDQLSRAEGIGRLRRQAQQKAAELIPAIFVDMFGDPAKNPKGWPVRQLADLLAETKLGLVRGAREMGQDLAYPYLRMDAIGSGYVQLSGLRRVAASPTEVAEYSLKTGDFLFNTRNSQELVGKTGAVAAAPPESTLFNNNLMRMRFHEDVVLPSFVNWHFQTDHVQRQLDSMKRGTTSVFAIYFKDLKNLQLMVPPIDRQRDFSERVAQFLAIQQRQKKAREMAEATFSALLARSFGHVSASASAALASEEAAIA
jgi:type I restriction enzyme S subunit